MCTFFIVSYVTVSHYLLQYLTAEHAVLSLWSFLRYIHTILLSLSYDTYWYTECIKRHVTMHASHNRVTSAAVLTVKQQTQRALCTHSSTYTINSTQQQLVQVQQLYCSSFFLCCCVPRPVAPVPWHHFLASVARCDKQCSIAVATQHEISYKYSAPRNATPRHIPCKNVTPHTTTDHRTSTTHATPAVRRNSLNEARTRTRRSETNPESITTHQD